MTDFRLTTTIRDIPEAQWQALQLNSGGTYPFLNYQFLAALEDSGCIGTGTATHASGWLAHYLVRHNAQGEAELIIPCFRKDHSYGEYVFDWSWAEAYQRYGLEYYPKLLWAVPFTPYAQSNIYPAGI